MITLIVNNVAASLFFFFSMILSSLTPRFDACHYFISLDAFDTLLMLSPPPLILMPWRRRQMVTCAE